MVDTFNVTASFRYHGQALPAFAGREGGGMNPWRKPAGRPYNRGTVMPRCFMYLPARSA